MLHLTPAHGRSVRTLAGVTCSERKSRVHGKSSGLPRRRIANRAVSPARSAFTSVEVILGPEAVADATGQRYRSWETPRLIEKWAWLFA